MKRKTKKAPPPTAAKPKPPPTPTTGYHLPLGPLSRPYGSMLKPDGPKGTGRMK